MFGLIKNIAKSNVVLATRYYVTHSVSFSLFGILCILFVVCLPLNCIAFLGPRGSFTKLNRTLCQWTFQFTLFFCRKVNFLDVRFVDEAKGDYGKLIVANHISMFDIVCMLAYFRHCGTFVNIKFLFNPFLTAIVFCSSYIPTAKTLASRAKVFRKSIQQLGEGYPFLVFPEGTRTKTGALGSLENGTFHIALASKSDITPVFLTIDRPFLNNTKMYRVYADAVRLNVHVLKKISVQSMDDTRENVLELKARVKSVFEDMRASPAALAWNRAEGVAV